jgi:hypothetical protein
MYHDEDFTSGWNDNDILFVLDQHSELDFYIAISLKQQSTDRHFAPLGQDYPDFEPIFLCSYSLMLHV